MADVPRFFTLAAKKRSERAPKLKTLLDNEVNGRARSQGDQ